MFVCDNSDVVKVAFIVFNGHLADVDLLGVRFSLLCLLLGLLLIGLKGFSFGLGLGGLHLGDSFPLSSLGGSLLLLFFSLRFFSWSLLLFVVFRVEFEVLGIELVDVSALSDHFVNLLLISRGFFFLVGVNLLLFLFLFTSGSGSCFSELRFFHLLTFGGSKLSGFHVGNILE